MGVTDDELLREFHQLSQGARELVQDYGAKLECQFRCLQERFPGRYVAAQLKDRFFHGMHECYVIPCGFCIFRLPPLLKSC